MRLARFFPVAAAAPLLLLSVTPLACSTQDDKEVLPPVVLGMEGDTPATYDDGQQQIYQVTREVRLNFRRHEDSERPQGDAPPYRRPPFHVASQSRITVRYTLTNLEDKQHIVELLVDPWNEFVRYVPGVQQDDEETIPNFSGIDKFFVLPPKARIEGIFTPDDMVEVAVDLTTAMRIQSTPPNDESAFAGAGLYNRAFNIQNRSSEPDPVLAPYMPLGPVAAIIGFDLGLRTYAQAKIAVELVIDVEDLEGNRLVEEGTDDRRLGPPGESLTPPANPMR
jgi:hypothetical protein